MMKTIKVAGVFIGKVILGWAYAIGAIGVFLIGGTIIGLLIALPFLLL